MPGETLKGVIYGKDLSEIRFVFDSYLSQDTPTPIELGEILVVEDRINHSKYLLRVINIAYGQNPEWSKQIARSYNRFQDAEDFADEHDEPSAIYQDDQKDQLFLEAICEILGYIDREGRFLSPKRLPSYFSTVRKLTTEDFESGLKNKLGDIEIGKIRSGSEVLNVGGGLFEKLLAKHIGVFAQTGGGKSNFMQVFVGKIMELQGRAGMLLFEPHGEYIQNLKVHPLAKEQLVCFAQDASKGRKLRIAYSDVTVGALMNVKDQLFWSEPQERFLREIESDLGPEWFWHMFNVPATYQEMETSATLDPLGRCLQAMFPDFKEDTIKATRSKLRQIKDAGYLVEDPTVSNIDEIMSLLDQGKVVLIDMASLSGLHELLLSTILTNKLLSRRRYGFSVNAKDFEDLPPVTVVMEEAQRVLGRNTSPSSTFAQICNEGRKFKVGLIAITQQPKLMNDILISQFNTLVILSISDEKDFHILSSISKKPIDNLRNEIRSLMPGEAIVTNPDAPFALPLKISLYEDYIKEVKGLYQTVKKGPSRGSVRGMV